MAHFLPFLLRRIDIRLQSKKKRIASILERLKEATKKARSLSFLLRRIGIRLQSKKKRIASILERLKEATKKGALPSFSPSVYRHTPSVEEEKNCIHFGAP